ncbi:MAG: hypothetical protein R3F65_19200 [bacterium]
MLTLLLALLAAPPITAPTTIEIRASIPRIDGAPLVDDPWLRARITRADALFAPYGLRFRLATTDLRDTTPDALTRAHRDALAPDVRPHVVNLFIVRRLIDIHEPGRVRRGVHWHAGGKHYVILAAYAAEGILAHELAHFFGNPKHRHRPGNLVGYLPGPWPTLDPDQQQRLTRALRRMIITGELRPAGQGTP